ncbi:MAG: glycogen-binding domain-containing protein, partial [Planctomycetota bacterium]
QPALPAEQEEPNPPPVQEGWDLTPTPLPEPGETEPIPAESDPAPSPASNGSQTASYGVEVTADGVRFVQPGPPEQSICVAGDFNLWSPTATPLPYDQDLDAHAAEIDLPAGRYQYRLIVDGRWVPDPYNEQHLRNTHGELNSLVVV